jgi:hypothetical protein
VKRLLVVIAIVLVVVIGIQFIPVGRTNPPIHADLKAAAKVHAILQRSCYNCHSNETRWPWYAHVAPISWMLANDVHEARSHVNFSDWGTLDPSLQARRAAEVWDEVKSGDMPLRQYLLIHPDARLSADDKSLIREWAETYGAALDPGGN